MNYYIITETNWAKLRDEILSLAECCHKAFGEKSKHTDWLHTSPLCSQSVCLLCSPNALWQVSARLSISFLNLAQFESVMIKYPIVLLLFCL